MAQELPLILNLLTVIGILWLIIKSRTKKRSRSGNLFLLDTSAIIDGRIAEVAQAGFLPGQLLIPQFVIAELQHIADSSDDLRRARGRFGLELVQKLQAGASINVKLISDPVNQASEVDDKLVVLAKRLGAYVVTTDFNLNKVATIHDVKVLNVNELAQAVRPLALPGEKLSIKLVQKGSDKGQAVGYLTDGTMVVVDRADKKIGQEVSVEVTRIMQTVAGKMLFAKLSNPPTRGKA